MNSYLRGAAVSSVLAAILMTGCSSDDSAKPASSSSTPLAEAVSTAKTKVEAITKVSSANAMLYGAIGVAPNFGDGWSTTNEFIDMTGDGSTKITLQKHLVNTLNPAALNPSKAAINIFGRMRSAINIPCALGTGLPASSFSGRYLTNGSHTLTLTAAIITSVKSTCGLDMTGMDGKAITITVTDASTTTHYDKKYAIDITAIDANQSIINFFIKDDASNVNLGFSDKSAQGQYRTMVHHNKTTDITRASYISDGLTTKTCATDKYYVYSYRLYYDGSKDQGTVLSSHSQCNSVNAAQSERFILAGKPNTTSASFSLSMIHGSIDTSKREACIKNDGTSISDGARCTASSTAVAGADVSAGASTLLDTLLTTTSGTNPADWYGSFNELDAPAFTTEAEMLTNNFAP
ncbi:MAG: hypothetical protein OEY52_11370 [Gammaproteobacteria bacterium]|nr:hypothetical protein [Gammaproteobacteria bacterium]